MQLLFLEYIKEYNDYEVITIKEEKKMWQELLSCWQ